MERKLLTKHEIAGKIGILDHYGQVEELIADRMDDYNLKKSCFPFMREDTVKSFL